MARGRPVCGGLGPGGPDAILDRVPTNLIPHRLIMKPRGYAQYSFVKSLRVGRYSEIQLLKHNDTRQFYAAKFFKIANDQELRQSLNERDHQYLKDAFKREVQLLKCTTHDYIIKLYETIHDGNSEGYVMEYCHRGSIHDIRAYGQYTDIDFLELMAQLVEAVSYLHNRGITHRDITPLNLLVALDGTLRLCDFNFALPKGVRRNPGCFTDHSG